MSKEHRFFESCAAAISPDWCVLLNDQMPLGQLDLASRTVRVYLVDTSTGWVTAGAFTPASFGLAADAARSAGLQGDDLADAAGARLGQLGQAAPVGGTEVDRCLQLVAAALANTWTFQLMKAQSKGPAGHWVYLAYRGHDASITCRPIYFGTHEAGFAPAGALADLVRQVVKQDTQTPASNVAQMLKKAGGAILADAYK